MGRLHGGLSGPKGSAASVLEWDLQFFLGVRYLGDILFTAGQYQSFG